MTATAIKERPILFTPAMAGKVHRGEKTQTRRMVKPQPLTAAVSASCDPSDTGGWMFFGLKGQPVSGHFACPYGCAGDRLWVRERLLNPSEDRMTYGDGTPLSNPLVGTKLPCKTIGSIHMPRWACRSVLEITEVRVERVESITDADAVAEGIEDTSILGNKSQWGLHEWGPEMQCVSPAGAFLNLFYDINKRAGRDANPWVWAITFRKVAP